MISATVLHKDNFKIHGKGKEFVLVINLKADFCLKFLEYFTLRYYVLRENKIFSRICFSKINAYTTRIYSISRFTSYCFTLYVMNANSQHS